MTFGSCWGLILEGALRWTAARGNEVKVVSVFKYVLSKGSYHCDLFVVITGIISCCGTSTVQTRIFDSRHAYSSFFFSLYTLSFNFHLDNMLNFMFHFIFIFNCCMLGFSFLFFFLTRRVWKYSFYLLHVGWFIISWYFFLIEQNA